MEVTATQQNKKVIFSVENDMLVGIERNRHISDVEISCLIAEMVHTGKSKTGWNVTTRLTNEEKLHIIGNLIRATKKNQSLCGTLVEEIEKVLQS